MLVGSNVVSVVTTVGAGSGVRLPAAGAGQLAIVTNSGANALLVYPASGGRIGASGVNVGVSVAVGDSLELVSIDGLSWSISAASTAGSLGPSGSPVFTGLTVTGVPSGVVTSASGVIGSTTSPSVSALTVTGAASAASLTVTGLASGIVNSIGGALSSQTSVSASALSFSNNTHGASGVLTSYRSVTSGSGATLSFGGGITGITYNTTYVKYSRVGDMVWVLMGIDLSSKGSSTGNAQITGLPYAPAEGTLLNFGAWYDGTNSAGFSGIYGVSQGGSSNVAINLFQVGAGAVSNIALTNTNFANTTKLTLQGHYTTTDPV